MVSYVFFLLLDGERNLSPRRRPRMKKTTNAPPPAKNNHHGHGHASTPFVTLPSLPLPLPGAVTVKLRELET